METELEWNTNVLCLLNSEGVIFLPGIIFWGFGEGWLGRGDMSGRKRLYQPCEIYELRTHFFFVFFCFF